MLYPVVVAVLVAGAAVTSWQLADASRDVLADLEPPPAAVFGPVEDGVTDFNSPAALTVTSSSMPPVLAGGLEGTVTSIEVRPGDSLETGQTLYRVNGIAVTAYVSDVVLYRDLARGTKGEDVRTVQEFLIVEVPQSGIVADGTYGPGTERAVRTFERSIGVGQPTGVMRAAYLARVPVEGYVVSSIGVVLGGGAPSPATEVIAATPQPATATLTSASAGPDGEYEFISNGKSIPVAHVAGAWEVDPAQVPQVLTQPLGADPQTIEGRTRLLDASPAQVVAGAAVITDSQARTCVAVAAGSGTQLRTVRMTGSDVSGAAHIAPVLDEGAQVLLNPFQILDSPACPSS